MLFSSAQQTLHLFAHLTIQHVLCVSTALGTDGRQVLLSGQYSQQSGHCEHYVETFPRLHLDLMAQDDGTWATRM